MSPIKLVIKITASAILMLSSITVTAAQSIQAFVTQNGELGYIEINIDGTRFSVNAMGRINSIDPMPTALSNDTHQRVNGISVIYDKCPLSTSSNPYQSSKAQHLNQAMRAFAASSSCPNQNGRLGKVLQIGNYRFSYYELNSFNSYSRNSPESGSFDKIQTVGPYRFTYYPLNTPGNKGGKVDKIIENPQ